MTLNRSKRFSIAQKKGSKRLQIAQTDTQGLSIAQKRAQNDSLMLKPILNSSKRLLIAKNYLIDLVLIDSRWLKIDSQWLKNDSQRLKMTLMEKFYFGPLKNPKQYKKYQKYNKFRQNTKFFES